MIQPQVPLRLPCYDLVPLTTLTFGAPLQQAGYEYLTNAEALVQIILWKGGDPAAGSPTATLLRLSPDHRARRGRLPSTRVR